MDQIFGAAVETIGNHKAIMKMYPGDMPYESEKLEGFRNDEGREGGSKNWENWPTLFMNDPTYSSKFCIYFLFYIMHKM